MHTLSWDRSYLEMTLELDGSRKEDIMRDKLCLIACVGSSSSDMFCELL